MSILILPPGGVDDVEIKAQQMRFAHPPVARDTGLIIDQRQFLAHQTVEQCGFADIGTADNDYLRQHGPQVAPLARNGKQNGTHPHASAQNTGMFHLHHLTNVNHTCQAGANRHRVNPKT